MFDRVDFKEDEKKQKKKEKGKLFGEYLMRRRKEKKMVDRMFFLKPIKKFSPQKKTVGRKFDLFIDHNAHMHLPRFFFLYVVGFSFFSLLLSVMV